MTEPREAPPDVAELIYAKWDDSSDGWYLESELEVDDPALDAEQ